MKIFKSDDIENILGEEQGDYLCSIIKQLNDFVDKFIVEIENYIKKELKKINDDLIEQNIIVICVEKQRLCENLIAKIKSLTLNHKQIATTISRIFFKTPLYIIFYQINEFCASDDIDNFLNYTDINSKLKNHDTIWSFLTSRNLYRKQLPKFIEQYTNIYDIIVNCHKTLCNVKLEFLHQFIDFHEKAIQYVCNESNNCLIPLNPNSSEHDMAHLVSFRNSEEFTYCKKIKSHIDPPDLDLRISNKLVKDAIQCFEETFHITKSDVSIEEYFQD